MNDMNDYTPNHHAVLMPYEAHSIKLRDGTVYTLRCNLNNLWMKQKYIDYKLSKNIPEICALTVEQRKDFEDAVLGYFARIYNSQHIDRLLYPFTEAQRDFVDGLCNSMSNTV